MRKFLSITIIFILVSTLFLFLSPSTEEAISDVKPFTPHEIRVLVVSPRDTYLKGGHYLIAYLAKYGFNITQQTSNDPIATNYLNDSKTSNLDQYDVVILHGIEGWPPSTVSPEEVAHFTGFEGTLIVIGNALFENETEKVKSPWWGFDSDPVRKIEQRLEVDFTDFLGTGGAWDNNGTFTLTNSTIKGLPSTLSYVTPVTPQYSIPVYQPDVTTKGASTIYDFTITSSASSGLVGKTTSGITYFKNSTTGAVGIYIQGSYIYAVNTGPSGTYNQISYFGLEDTPKRSALLASLIAFSLGKDIDTIIKPQPFASIRLDGVGQYYPETYLNASLSNFDSILDEYNITPTIGFTDFLDFKPDYWQTVASEVLSQLKSKYRDWEYDTNLRYYTDPRLMTKEQIKDLIDSIKGKYSALEMDLFSIVVAPRGLWNQSTLDAMGSENLYLLDILDNQYSDSWNLRVNSSVIVHSGAEMLPQSVWDGVRFVWAENFTQLGLDKDSIHYSYFKGRDEWALAVVHGFPTFVFYVSNFRWNEVGTCGLQTIFRNLTSEVPDIRFVPLMEAGLYFGNKWMRIENASRSGSIVEFDVDTSAIPSVVNIEKGMLWLRINANESVQEVSIDNNPWFYFDNHSIRMPAPETSAHVKVTLGSLPNPRVAETRYKVLEARYDGYSLGVSVVSAQGLNVSVQLLLPKVGPFRTDNWSVFCLQAEWSYKFDPKSRILKFWAISDGFVTLEAGVFWIIEQTTPWYNSSVTIAINITGLQTDIQEVTLSYYVSDRWINVTMTPKERLWVATIPAKPYGTVVEYQAFIRDVAGHRLATGIFSYNVTDETPPEVGVPAWDPPSPAAEEPVSVEIFVTEPENASGVKQVVLWYYPLTLGLAGAKNISMTRESDLWSAVIPGQSGDSSVLFFIMAYDKAGNVKPTPHHSYKVAYSALLVFPPFQILVLGIGLASGIVAILYFIKFKKSKR